MKGEIKLWISGLSQMNNDLLFYNEYENFYSMAKDSSAFKHFCEKAFGKDLSQDGFSDISQLDRILPYIPSSDDSHVLDIGCGNGKALGYIQAKTGAYIHGFDYSHNAIETARSLFTDRSEFIEGCIGEVDYPAEHFDAIVSMDSMYFAPDMAVFVGQLLKWLKKGGVFVALYQEGDVMPKTEDKDTSVLARILASKGIPYECIDITRESYDLLLKKRDAAMSLEHEFSAEGNSDWYEMLLAQTEYANRPFEEYAGELARYIYVVRN